MNFDGDMICWGKYDISELKQRVLKITDDTWLEISDRQEEFAVHKKTQTIPLVIDDGTGMVKPVILPRHADYVDILAPLYELVARRLTSTADDEPLVEGKEYGFLANSLLVRLKPKSDIPKHMDNAFTLAHAHRIHVPILTSENVHFTVGDMSADMKEGEIWEINNRHLHSVQNNGSDNRVHLILDWRIPYQSCCCGRKKHLGIPCTPGNCVPETRLCDCYAG